MNVLWAQIQIIYVQKLPTFLQHQCHVHLLVSQSLYYFHGDLLALSISAYGSGFTCAFLQAAVPEISPFIRQEKGL